MLDAAFSAGLWILSRSLIAGHWLALRLSRRSRIL